VATGRGVRVGRCREEAGRAGQGLWSLSVGDGGGDSVPVYVRLGAGSPDTSFLWQEPEGPL